MKLDLDNPMEEVRIEVIPLIDVIFCILTFFILAAVGLTRQQAISLDLPKASTGSPVSSAAAAGRNRLYVSVDAAGQVYVDQSPVPKSILYDVARQHQQIAPDGLIVLYAARDARYEDVISVLDLLRSVGGDRVALATLPGNNLAQPDSPTGLEGIPGTPGSAPAGSPGNTLPDSEGLNELLNPVPSRLQPGTQPGANNLDGLPGVPSVAPGSPAAPSQPVAPQSAAPASGEPN
jgi:biopolymer transport protein ExbD